MQPNENTLDIRCQRLLSLYREEIRGFLADQQVQGLDGLDRQAEVLEEALKRPVNVSIGFVGESQVGKSTLINAVLERHALPSGGIGPLTAQQTRVIHGSEDRLAVTYHGKQALNRLVFALERHLTLRGDLPSARDAVPTSSDADLAETGDIVTEVQGEEDGKGSGVSARALERATYLFSQARRMLGAKSDVSDPVLLDALRVVLEREPHGPAEAVAPFMERCAELRARMGKQEVVAASHLPNPSAFQAELRLRAAGWLSPMVAQLSLELASTRVEGLTLVDLPGIGVVADAAANEAQRFVESEGQALVIVFRQNGLTESVAHLLEKTGVITKLLFGGRDGIAPIQVILVVTHLDDVAKTQLELRAQAALEVGGDIPDRHAIFRELAREMESKTREQVTAALLRSAAFEDLEGAQEATRRAVIDRLSEDLRVICVAAPDYMQKRVGPDLGLAFLTNPDATGIPELGEALHQTARVHRARRRRDIVEAQRALLTTVDAHLGSLRKSLDDGRGVAHERWERFCEELVAFAEPLRLEMHALHGEVAGTLRRGLLESIYSICGEAERQGLKRLRSLLRQAKGMHFQTLNAALRRDGRWNERDINFPDALTLAVIDSIASDWEPRIIESVRAEVRRLADRDVKLVEQLVQRARELDAKIAEDAPIDEQKRILQENSRSAVAWTKDQLEELRQTVQARLRDTVSKPIERACRQAIKAGANTQSGAKDRIIDTFEEGGVDALSEARTAARSVLIKAYEKLLRKLEDGFLKDFHDPVQSAVDALTDQTGARARRSDAKRRKATGEALEQHVRALADVRVDHELEAAA